MPFPRSLNQTRRNPSRRFIQVRKPPSPDLLSKPALFSRGDLLLAQAKTSQDAFGHHNVAERVHRGRDDRACEEVTKTGGAVIGSWVPPFQPRSSLEQVEIAGIAKGPVAFPKSGLPWHGRPYLDGSDLGVHEPHGSQQIAWDQPRSLTCLGESTLLLIDRVAWQAEPEDRVTASG